MINTFLDLSHSDDRHLILTPKNILLRSTFPWAFSIQKILHAARSRPFHGKHLFVGSDFGGNHKGAKYKTYAFLVVNDQPSPWLQKQKIIRDKYLTDSRRMSFKRLSDPIRQRALVPFLQAADTLNGHLVVFAVHKSVRLHPHRRKDVNAWRDLFKFSGKWNHRSLEDAMRKAHLFSLIVSQWSKPFMDVTWITDQDEFVANDARLDDVQKIAARFSSLYLPHTLREFAMNTAIVDDSRRYYEDLLSIPDLAAGLWSELLNHISKVPTWSDVNSNTELEDDLLQSKTDLLLDWYSFEKADLQRTCIIIDNINGKGRVFKLDPLIPS